MLFLNIETTDINPGYIIAMASIKQNGKVHSFNLFNSKDYITNTEFHDITDHMVADEPFFADFILDEKNYEQFLRHKIYVFNKNFIYKYIYSLLSQKEHFLKKKDSVLSMSDFLVYFKSDNTIDLMEIISEKNGYKNFNKPTFVSLQKSYPHYNKINEILKDLVTVKTFRKLYHYMFLNLYITNPVQYKKIMHNINKKHPIFDKIIDYENINKIYYEYYEKHLTSKLFPVFNSIKYKKDDIPINYKIEVGKKEYYLSDDSEIARGAYKNLIYTYEKVLHEIVSGKKHSKIKNELNKNILSKYDFFILNPNTKMPVGFCYYNDNIKTEHVYHLYIFNKNSLSLYKMFFSVYDIKNQSEEHKKPAFRFEYNNMKNFMVLYENINKNFYNKPYGGYLNIFHKKNKNLSSGEDDLFVEKRRIILYRSTHNFNQFHINDYEDNRYYGMAWFNTKKTVDKYNMTVMLNIDNQKVKLFSKYEPTFDINIKYMLIDKYEFEYDITDRIKQNNPKNIDYSRLFINENKFTKKNNMMVF